MTGGKRRRSRLFGMKTKHQFYYGNIDKRFQGFATGIEHIPFPSSNLRYKSKHLMKLTGKIFEFCDMSIAIKDLVMTSFVMEPNFRHLKKSAKFVFSCQCV